MVACRRHGAFCKVIVSTARRGGLPFAPAKGSKTGQRGTGLSPLQTPLTLSCAGYEYCFSLNNREKQIRTAHRCAPKVATAYLPPPPCGARKNLRAARLLDFFDRYGCSASLHPPLAVLGSASPSTATPSPSKIAQQIPVLLSQQNPLFMRISPINPQSCKLSIKKSEILTFHMQKRLHFAVIVKGLFPPQSGGTTCFRSSKI